MAESFNLKNGETLTCRIVDDPDDTDATRIVSLLVHKGGHWQRHFDEWLDSNIKRLTTRFYIGTIGDDIVGNIMVISFRGLGLMGHVYTSPDHRRKGICDVLMDFHMDDFRDHNGTALFLNTGFESPPYQIYERHGYLPVPGRPGSMWWSPKHTEIDELWAGIYSDPGESVSSLSWQHWPSMNAFFHLPTEQIVRNVTYGRYGISEAEWPFLAVKNDITEDRTVQARVIETGDGHMSGLATLAPERRWGALNTTSVFDLFVHPDAADMAPKLIEAFDWPDNHVLAYAAETDELTIDLLSEADFHPHSHIERFFEDDTGLVIMDRD